jgi:hypothetical protein
LLPDFTPLPNLFFLALGALELELTEAEQAAVPSPKAQRLVFTGFLLAFLLARRADFFAGSFAITFFLVRR